MNEVTRAHEKVLNIISEEIAKEIMSAIHLNNTFYSVEYRGKAIKIERHIVNKEIYIWIRVIYDRRTMRVALDFSIVSFGPDLRRHGTFTRIINKLKTNDNISCIRVTGVCTEEMFNWCKKHGFKPSEIECDFVWYAQNN